MVCIYKCVMNIYMVLWVRASIRFCACSCHFNAIGFPYIGLSPLGLRETRWAMEMKLSCWVRERQNASSTRCVWTRSIGTTRPLSEAGIFAGLRWEGHLGAHKTNGFLRKKQFLMVVGFLIRKLRLDPFQWTCTAWLDPCGVGMKVSQWITMLETSRGD